MFSRDFICLMCPNGCHLTTAVQADGSVAVQGNRCDKGYAFAKRVLASPGQVSPRIVAGKKRSDYSVETLRDIASFWDVSLKQVFAHLMPEGSPERTLFRIVIGDDRQRTFVLEQIPAAAYHNKMKIIRTLEYLGKQGMPQILPYTANAVGQYIQEHPQGLWQMVSFVRGVPLDRERYLYEGWRAPVLSRFLLELRERSRDLPVFRSERSFSIKEYIAQLARQIERRQPRILPRVARVTEFLERRFWVAHDQLPTAFCHGDYHPLNIIWGSKELLAVIDWEFAGRKPEIYDAANMTGCLGMEHPSSLTDELVVGFLRELRASGLFSPASWEFFPEFVIALRFAWLSEWLRKQDEEMVALELDYFDLLIDNLPKLKRAWGI